MAVTSSLPWLPGSRLVRRSPTPAIRAIPPCSCSSNCRARGARRGRWSAHALHLDRFGNVQLDVAHDDLADTGVKLGHRLELTLPSGDEISAQFARTFADVARGELIVYEDASRRLALAVSHGSAAAELGLGLDDEVRITPT